MKIYTENEIVDLVTRFENLQLQKDEWTHDAHLIVAIWHWLNYSEEKVLPKIRARILALNGSLGIINSETSGYHETITIFWITVIQQFVKLQSNTSITYLCHEFLVSRYAERTFPLDFYSKALLFSKEARLFWIKPDIREIDLTSVL